MTHGRYFVSGILIWLLTGCDYFNETDEPEADYKGQFYTQEVQCPGSAELTVHTEGGRVEIGFYCFIRPCFVAKGRVSQGGFFEVRTGAQQYVKGRLSPDRAMGDWQLILNGKNCHGRFDAERISPYRHTPK